jgi:hypothetical protein
LRQTPKQWHTKFDKVMLPNEFKINEVDKYIYVKNTDKYYIIICLYMDDMLILGSNGHMIKSTKKILTKMFDIKDLGVVDVIPDIKTYRTSD